MPAPSDSNRIVRFGVFEVDLQEAELRRSGLRQKLSPQAFEVLRALLKRPGEIITREELRERLWPENTTVAYDLGLKKCINRIRDVLGDSPDHPRFIETVPRRGYRFVAPVQEAEPFANGTGYRLEKIQPVDTQSDPGGQTRRRGKGFKSILIAGLSVTVIVVISWLLTGRGHDRSSTQTVPTPAITLLPLTSTEGDQMTPALSPDGSRVVFMRSARKRSESGLYVAVVGSQSSVKLIQTGSELPDEAEQADGHYSPAWSPDGREVAFLRDKGEEFLIQTVPALGGAAKTIYAGPRAPRNYETGKGGLSFSPDGKLLAFSEWNAATRRSFIKVMSLREHTSRVLTSPPPACDDRRPAFSTLGDKLAFIRSSGPSVIEELFVISPLGGEPKQVTFDHKQIFGPPAWTQTGEIVFSSNRGGLPAIWRVAGSGGNPQRVPGAGPAWSPSISLNGNELAYDSVDEEQNLWSLELNDSIHAPGPASILVPSAKNQNLQPQFSPDGRKIAFQSERSGYSEVWICNRDGSGVGQVTDLRGFAGSPRFSPDSRYLTFDYRSQHHSDIYVVETSGGRPKSIVAFPEADSFLPSWSRDGRWIYFTSNRGEKSVYQIWKQSVQGGAGAGSPPIQVTQNGGFGAVETLDGRMLLYTKPSSQGIFAMPPDGGIETPIWNGPGPDNWSNWAITTNGIYFFAPETGRPPKIEYLDLKNRKLSQLGRLTGPSFYGLAVSPDGGSLLYSQWDRNEHQILVMENFR